MSYNMSPEDRSKNVRIMILRALDQCGGYMLAENTLFVQLNIELRPPAATVEFSAALEALSALRAVASVRPELGGSLQWKITAQGRAVLAENM